MGSTKIQERCIRCGDPIPKGEHCNRCRTSSQKDAPRRRSSPARFLQGMSYPLQAVTRLASTPGMGRYMLLPIMINIALFALLLAAAIWGFDPLYSRFITSADVWWARIIEWLAFLLYLLAVLVVFFFTFGVVGTIVAGPFCEPISRRVEWAVLGRPSEEASGPGIVRESIYSVTHVLGMLLVGLGALVIIIPLSFIPLVGPVLAIILASWVTAFEYLEASLARKHYRLGEMMGFVMSNKASTLGFGMAIQLLLLVPILNFFAILLGSAGATDLFLQADPKPGGGRTRNAEFASHNRPA